MMQPLPRTTFNRARLLASSLALALSLPLVVAQPYAQALSPLAELPAATYQLDQAHASLLWRVSHLGLSQYTARFTDFDATLTIDPANPTAASLTATVNPASVETDYPNAAEKDFDAVLRGENWFNTAKFPAITYTSREIIMTGENTARILGDLTFMGVTKPLELAATFNGGYAQKPFAEDGVAALGFSARGTMTRSEWGMSGYLPAIGDEVEIVLETEFQTEPMVKRPE